ncbi:ribosomal protection-like ABC-F family protein [Streptomyces sp. WAC08241]|uniref:ribosomal protection-like ABC-F family protein n=1 Tax=Streptomyces sp. WAC08241 TaxID=2487421 RepID=UPI000F797AE0|nr:ABC-F family ATP-binding cassette domain-containing protein [Streptomyces sp. WAC08241]RSS35541.1 ABC transporter ATP-binding protein [Streptomyces sp. WAC08241]
MFRAQLTDVTKHYVLPDARFRTVLDRVSLTVRPGERLGVVGDNGSGKSTLLRLLAGLEAPDDGSVDVEAPGGLGHLAQTLDLPPDATVGDAVDHALAEVRELERAVRAAEADLAATGDLDGYARLLAAHEARGGAGADRRVETTLRRLGEQRPLDRARPLGTLSGGQRSRLALAAVLAAEPELLLLDEPTNDLDDEAVAWLEERLRAHRGTVVAVSHDRVFLDRVATAVLEVDEDRHTLRRYGNGYGGYLAGWAAERARRVREYEEWKDELARYTALADTHIDRFSAIPRKAPAAFSGAGAFRARSRAHGAMSRVRAARERLARLTAHPVPAPPEPLRFRADLAGGGAPVDLVDVRVEGRLRLDALHLDAGERLLVTGPNGAGKSTLLKVLAGELAPDGGFVGAPARVGLLRQETAPPTDPRTVAEAFGADRDPDRADELLALGLFAARDLGTPVRHLSVGQRRKLELARLVTSPADLLLLDEPTNHLAPGLVEEIEAALAAYRGTLVVVSHDRRLRAGFRGRVLALAPEAALTS